MDWGYCSDIYDFLDIMDDETSKKRFILRLLKHMPKGKIHVEICDIILLI